LHAPADCGTAHALATTTIDHDAATETDALLFRLFAVAWGLAALFHTEYLFLFIHEQALAPKVSAAVLTVAAVATCWRPTVGTLAALALAQLIDVWVLLPAVPNHWLLAGLVNLALLLGWIRARQPAAFVALVRAPLMVSVVLFYVWTGVWKLNTDFFRPDVSCAVMSWERVLGFFRWLPDALALRRGVIVGTLAMELLGPVLLLVPATRGAAVVSLIAFHVGLGLDALKVYLNFASVMFALLLLFLPDAAVERLRRLVPANAGRLPRLASAGYLVLAAAGVAAGSGSPLYLVGRWFVWLAYAIGLVVLVFLAVVGAPRPRRWLPAGAAGSLAWLVPGLVMLNGLAPILGLKTRTSWQMYSNVRLEPTASNHFLVPRSLDLAGAMREPVTVVESSGTQFRDVVGTALALPWIEFRRRVAAEPDATVTWERSGERHTTARVADDPVLSRPLPLAVRKLMIFRPLGPGVEARCDW
jgi:hypothetical protein